MKYLAGVLCRELAGFYAETIIAQNMQNDA